MMTPDEVRNVGNVYRRLLEGDSARYGWGSIDDCMERLGYLDDSQLTKEAEVAFCHHAGKNPRCPKQHDVNECFVPLLVEAVNSILELYRETPSLHEKNRYILEYYLTLDHEKMIVID
jgi:hypothetical protein